MTFVMNRTEGIQEYRSYYMICDRCAHLSPNESEIHEDDKRMNSLFQHYLKDLMGISGCDI